MTLSKDIIGSAMRWVSREQSYPALCREIAWTAARSTGMDHEDLEWLVSLVDGRLAERIADLPLVIRRASFEARHAHLRDRPHDGDGAELVADVAARDAAVEYLSTAYMDVLDWAVGVLHDRRAMRLGRVRWWRRLSRQPSVDEPVQCEVSERILDGLTRRATQPGWHDRRAA